MGAGLFAAASPSLALGAPIAYEGFGYAAGFLDGNNGGSGFSGAWSATQGARVTSGLTHPSALPGTGGGAWSTIGGAGTRSLPDFTGSSFWVSFLYDANGATAPSGSLKVAGNGPESLSFAASASTIDIAGNTFSGPSFGFSLARPATGTSLVVLQYVSGTGTVNAWVNPDAASPGAPQGTGHWGGLGTGLRGLDLDLSSLPIWDEIRIGTTRGDVMQVPGVGGAWLFGLGGAAGLRRQRRRCTISA